MASSKKKVALVWLRNDLRLADHEPLFLAASSSYDHLLPFYCFDPSNYQPRSPSASFPPMPPIPREGPHRAQFRLDALRSLTQSLQTNYQSGLHVHLGPTTVALSDILAEIATLVPRDDSSTPGSQTTVVDLLHHLEAGPEAADLESRCHNAFLASLKAFGFEGSVRTFWAKTLYHPDDADPFFASTGKKKGGRKADEDEPKRRGPPLPINADTARFAHYPPVMTNFRKELQGRCVVRAPLPAPAKLPPPPFAPNNDLPGSVTELYERLDMTPSLRALEALTGVPTATSLSRWDERSAFPFEASEAAAHQRLRGYMFGAAPCPSGTPARPHRRHPLLVEADEARAGSSGASNDTPFFSTFAETKAQGVGVENSTKLSPYLALGLLTPRQVHEAIADYQRQVGGGGGGRSEREETASHWLLMHLAIRDFYVYSALGAGEKLFQPEGIKAAGALGPAWNFDPAAFERWAQGRTGLPFVDANMRELAATGFMSNRGRQNVASLLAKALEVDWRAGCALFESLLLDHDWSVNTTCWAYVAGTGNDPKNRFFKTVSQGETYDDQAHLARMWIPELAGLASPKFVHQPWLLEETERKGLSYPQPMVDPQTQIKPETGSAASRTGGKKEGVKKGKEWMASVSEQLLQSAKENASSRAS